MIKIAFKQINLVIISLFIFLLTFTNNGFSVVAFPNISRTSEVSTQIKQNQDGSYTYNYTLKNTSPAPQLVGDVGVWPTIIDFEIPLNNPSVVCNISSPDQWSYEFISYNDYILRFGEPNPFLSPYVIHWYTLLIPNGVGTKPIVPEGYNSIFGTNYYEPQTDGFIFTSFQPPVSGPYLASWWDEFRNIGDPPLPGGSPVGGGGTPSFNPIPIPPTFLLLISGLAGIFALRKRL